MSYESAPATQLVATHCCCCSRPLVDADSVELGIGPECRRKHGFLDAPEHGDVDLAAKLSGLDLPEDGRQAANKLVHRLACNADGDAAELAYINALRALGYAKLAGKLESRLARVRIEAREDRILVHTPYEPGCVEDFRGVNGRRWEKAEKAWSFPFSAKPEVWNILRRHFAGAAAVGPKGLFRIN